MQLYYKLLEIKYTLEYGILKIIAETRGLFLSANPRTILLKIREIVVTIKILTAIGFLVKLALRFLLCKLFARV